MADFSTRIRALRRKHGWTQQLLSDRSGIHPTALGRYERGLQPSIDTVIRLALAFGVDPRELMEPVIADAVANGPTAPPPAV